MRIITVPPDRWHGWRRKGIGSSDAAPILGVSPHTTRLAVYLSKIGQTTQEERKQATDWGLLLEDDIATALSHRIGCEYSGEQVCGISDTWPELRATLDRVTTDGRVVELKAVGAWTANEMPPDGEWEGLPQHWIVQAHHQMIVADVQEITFAVFVPLELRVYRVPMSERLRRVVVDMELEFWECVQAKEAPRTLDVRDLDRITQAYPDVEGTVDLGDDYVEHFRRFAASKDPAAKVALLDAMGSSEWATLPTGERLIRRRKTRKGYTVEPKTSIELSVYTPRNGESHADE